MSPYSRQVSGSHPEMWMHTKPLPPAMKLLKPACSSGVSVEAPSRSVLNTRASYFPIASASASTLASPVTVTPWPAAVRNSSRTGVDSSYGCRPPDITIRFITLLLRQCRAGQAAFDRYHMSAAGLCTVSARPNPVDRIMTPDRPGGTAAHAITQNPPPPSFPRRRESIPDRVRHHDTGSSLPRRPAQSGGESWITVRVSRKQQYICATVAVGGKIRREARTAFVQACSLRVAGTSAAGLGSDE